MPTNGLLYIVESLARAITAQENLDWLTRNVTSAYGNELNFNGEDTWTINFSHDRPGVPYRRYGCDKKANHWTGTSRKFPNLRMEKIRLETFAIYCAVCVFLTAISFVIAL